MRNKTTIAGLAADFDMEQWRTPKKRTWRISVLELGGLILFLFIMFSMFFYTIEAISKIN